MSSIPAASVVLGVRILLTMISPTGFFQASSRSGKGQGLAAGWWRESKLGCVKRAAGRQDDGAEMEFVGLQGFGAQQCCVPTARQPEGQPPLRDLDATGVAAQVLEFETDLGPRGRQGKALGPFEDSDGGLGENVFEAESLEIVEIFDAVKVGVVDLGGVRGAVDMNQGERRTGDFVFGGGAQPGDDAFGERGLP